MIILILFDIAPVKTIVGCPSARGPTHLIALPTIVAVEALLHVLHELQVHVVHEASALSVVVGNIDHLVRQHAGDGREGVGVVFYYGLLIGGIGVVRIAGMGGY